MANWLEHELQELKEGEKELFEEIHFLFHVTFACFLVFIVVFILVITIFIAFYRLTRFVKRKKSLRKILDQQAACQCSVRTPHYKKEKASPKHNSSKDPLLPIYSYCSIFQPRQSVVSGSKPIMCLEKLQVWIYKERNGEILMRSFMVYIQGS